MGNSTRHANVLCATRPFGVRSNLCPPQSENSTAKGTKIRASSQSSLFLLLLFLFFSFNLLDFCVKKPSEYYWDYKPSKKSRGETSIPEEPTTLALGLGLAWARDKLLSVVVVAVVAVVVAPPLEVFKARSSRRYRHQEEAQWIIGQSAHCHLIYHTFRRLSNSTDLRDLYTTKDMTNSGAHLSATWICLPLLSCHTARRDQSHHHNILGWENIFDLS